VDELGDCAVSPALLSTPVTTATTSSDEKSTKGRTVAVWVSSAGDE
jgi:hypothetical protein